MASPVVLITGALTGIGRATAFAFARDGAQLVVSGRHDAAGSALTSELRDTGAQAEFVRADVRQEDDVRNLVDRAVARFGRLDIAVNNAGTEGRPGTLTEQSAEDYRAIFDTNVLGTMLSSTPSDTVTSTSAAFTSSSGYPGPCNPADAISSARPACSRSRLSVAESA